LFQNSPKKSLNSLKSLWRGGCGSLRDVQAEGSAATLTFEDINISEKGQKLCDFVPSLVDYRA